MTITYEEALATLQSMFADAWTRDLLDEVLRHEKGHMENTVDLILRHGDQDPKILVDQLAAGIDPQQNAAALDEALARQLSMGNVNGPRSGGGGRAGGAGGGTTRPRGKGKPTTLPDDFLRVPGYTPPPQSSLSDDEALARMLQDELFTEELRRNPDFAHLARGRSNVRAPSSSVGGSAAGGPNPAVVAASKIGEMARNFTANVNRNLAAASAASNNNHTASDDPMSPNIMQKLSEMGDSAKRRLQLLAAQFNATAAGEAMASGPSSSANPTTNEVRRSEFRGLLDDDDNDNMELAARKDL
jgi:CUE domain